MRNFNQLTYVDLSNNELWGPIHELFHDLENLRLLNLGQNSLSGEIPRIIGEHLNNLRGFFKSFPEGGGNQFTSLRQKYLEFWNFFKLIIYAIKICFWSIKGAPGMI